MKEIEVSAAIIINKDKKILVTQRGYGEFKGMWEFPGGKLEKGETPENALIREIKEELNVDIKIEKHLNTIKYDYPSFHLKMHNFICDIKFSKIVLKEHESAKFIIIDQFEQLDFLPADKLILSDLKKYLKTQNK